MLDRLRAGKQGILAWLVIGGIIVTFVLFFGPGSFGKDSAACGGGPAYAARVNGRTVQVEAYSRRYDALFRMADRQFGGRLTRDLADQIGLNKQAMDAVVDEELLSQEAERRGIQVTDEELGQVIGADPTFQENGAYSPDAYRRWADENYGSRARFETILRAQLLSQKLEAAFEETVKVSPTEVRERWEMYSNRAELTYVLFPTTGARGDVKVTDEDVKAFQGREAARIEAFYKEHPERFDQKKKVRVRHVLARIDGTQDEAAARKKIDQAHERLAKGEAFEKVAAALSDDTNTKDCGGDLGLIAEGLADEAFMKAALALEPGKVSDPVRTAFGWDVLRVDEVIPARQLTLDQARPEIARELLTDERAAAVVKEKAQAALAGAKGGKALTALYPADEKAAQKLGGQPLVSKDSGQFSTALPYIPGLGEHADLVKDVAAANAGDVLPKVYETPAGALVAQVKTRERPDQAKFVEAQPQVTLRLREEKAGQLRRAWLQELRAKATIDENPQLVAAAAPVQPPVEQ
ncbi:MAG: SurA N-terminal domain-containing protein [Anaeromyxobacter sp.]